MSTWSTVIRQVLLRGNFIAGDKTAVKTTYETALLTDTQITKGGAEYPFLGIVDAFLDAMEIIVGAIGANRESAYRRWFAADTANIASGGQIPTVSSIAAPRYGVLSNVRDATNGRYLTFQPRVMIRIAKEATHGRRKRDLYHYFTDDVVIEHTRTNVKAEIVAWSRDAEQTVILADNDTYECPLPNDLLPVLEYGALAFIYRDKFNLEQAVANYNKFAPEVNKIAGKQMAATELPAKI